MSKPGPHPTPTRVLRLRGSWRAKRNPKEPTPEVKKPTTPAWLSDGAKKLFEDYAERLHASGVLTTADEFALARYADLCGQYCRAAEFVAKHGDVYVTSGRPGPNGEPGKPTGFKTYPQAKRLLHLAQALLQLEREFGLTPSARTGLSSDLSTVAGEPPLSFDYFNTGGGSFAGRRRR